MRVPRELAIVGYDDIDFAAAAVPLTSLRQQVVFTLELVARTSTRGLSRRTVVAGRYCRLL